MSPELKRLVEKSIEENAEQYAAMAEVNSMGSES